MVADLLMAVTQLHTGGVSFSLTASQQTSFDFKNKPWWIQCSYNVCSLQPRLHWHTHTHSNRVSWMRVAWTNKTVMCSWLWLLTAVMWVSVTLRWQVCCILCHLWCYCCLCISLYLCVCLCMCAVSHSSSCMMVNVLGSSVSVSFNHAVFQPFPAADLYLLVGRRWQYT